MRSEKQSGRSGTGHATRCKMLLIPGSSDSGPQMHQEEESACVPTIEVDLLQNLNSENEDEDLIVPDCRNSTNGEEKRSISTRWSNFTHRWQYTIVAFYIALVWPLGAVYFPRFIRATSSEFKPSIGTLSYEADKVYKEAYNVVGERLPVIILLEQPQLSNSSNETLVDGHSDLYKSTRDFVLNISAYLEELAGSFSGNNIPTRQIPTYSWNKNSSHYNYYAHISSYYAVEKAGLYSLARHAFASRDGHMTFVRVEFTTPSDQTKRIFLEELVVACTEKFSVSKSVNISFTGMHYFQQDMLDGIRSDLRRMDFFSLPLALLVVAFVLRQGGAAGNTNLDILSIVVVPLLTIISTTALAGIIMYPIAECVMEVTQFTPSLMMSLIIAMSIDYSLFLLSRFIEDFDKVQDKKLAIVLMVKYSGHTIITSGVTLCCSFLGLFLLPLPMLQSVGGGAIVAIFSALFVNLSLVPALLHTRLGSRMVGSNECCQGIRVNITGWLTFATRRFDQRASPDDYDHDHGINIVGASPEGYFEDLSSDLLSSRVDNHKDDEIEEITEAARQRASSRIDCEEVKMKRSGWYKLGHALLNPSKGALILTVIVGMIAPVAYFLPQCGSSISFNLMIPVLSPSKQAFNRLGAQFGLGALSPYKIIFSVRTPEERIDSLESFEMIKHVLDQLTGDEFPATPDIHSFTSIATMNGQHMSHWFYETSLICGRTCFFEEMRTVATIAHVMNSPHALATYASVMLNVDPFSDEGVQWLIRAREKINVISNEGEMSKNVTVTIAGSASIEYDAVKSVYKHFPIMIVTTFVLVMAMMGCFFRSFVVPLRSVLSIALTEAFVFGLAVLVYQHGIFDFLGVRGLSYTGDISWLPPIFSFSVIMGLSLDYDVFLVSRVLEFRMKGFDHKSSIIAGLYKTGGIITAAGIIMFVAFVALLGSETVILNQTAFLLTSAVLVDTFVVRIFVVPILMGFTGRLSWWPRKDLPSDADCNACVGPM